MINKIIINRYLSLDNKRLPLYIRLYMMFSSEVRSEINTMQYGLQALIDTSPYQLSSNISKKVMASIYHKPVYVKQSISNINWISVGIMLLSGLVTLSFSEYFKWLNGNLGSYVSIYLYAVFGIAITAYAAMFIAAHIELFKKYKDIFKFRL